MSIVGNAPQLKFSQSIISLSVTLRIHHLIVIVLYCELSEWQIVDIFTLCNNLI